jgi:hypothetical protein
MRVIVKQHRVQIGRIDEPIINTRRDQIGDGGGAAADESAGRLPVSRAPR